MRKVNYFIEMYLEFSKIPTVESLMQIKFTLILLCRKEYYILYMLLKSEILSLQKHFSVWNQHLNPILVISQCPFQ